MQGKADEEGKEGLRVLQMRTLQIEQCVNEQQRNAESSANAAEVFTLICKMWPRADNSVKRRILEIIFVNFTLDGEKLVPSKRTPFELLSAA